MTAHTTNVGAVPFPPRHGRQVGAHRHAARVGLLHPVVGVHDILLKPHPPKKRTLMRGPLTPKVSLRYIASQREARVFSSAHTPVSPPGFSRRTSMVPASKSPARRRRPSRRHSVSAEEIVLAVRTAGVVRVRAASHAKLVRVVAASILHGDAVFQGLTPETAVNAIDCGRRWPEGRGWPDTARSWNSRKKSSAGLEARYLSVDARFSVATLAPTPSQRWLRTSVGTSESGCARAPCGDLTRGEQDSWDGVAAVCGSA